MTDVLSPPVVILNDVWTHVFTGSIRGPVEGSRRLLTTAGVDPPR